MADCSVVTVVANGGFVPGYGFQKCGTPCTTKAARCDVFVLHACVELALSVADVSGDRAKTEATVLS